MRRLKGSAPLDRIDASAWSGTYGENGVESTPPANPHDCLVKGVSGGSGKKIEQFALGTSDPREATILAGKHRARVVSLADAKRRGAASRRCAALAYAPTIMKRIELIREGCDLSLRDIGQRLDELGLRAQKGREVERRAGPCGNSALE